MGRIEGGLSWSLADPGMGLLERAGLAGLYMTLRAAEEQRHDLSPMTWELSPDHVTVHWNGTTARDALSRLFAFAWQVRDGVLYLPAVHRDARQRDTAFLRLAEHKGILSTFLQHNKVEPRGKWQTRIETIDEDKELAFAYQPIESDQLKAHRDLAQFFDRADGLANKLVKLSSWVTPGISPRFTALENAWSGTPDVALLLMIAPIVCMYQQIQGEPNSCIFLTPDVRDLEQFDIVRPELALDPVNTSGPGDAALHFVAEYASRSVRREAVAGCKVTAVGVAGYFHTSNKTRKGIQDVEPGADAVPMYRILHRVMGSRFISRRDPQPGGMANVKGTKKGKRKEAVGEQAVPAKGHPDESRPLGFMRVPSARGRIADNLIAGRHWYENLLEPPRWEHDSLEDQRKRDRQREGKDKSVHRLWFDNLRRYQRRQLMELANDKQFWSNPQELLFHEAFRKVLWRLCKCEQEAAKKGSGSRSAEERVEDLYDDLHRRLMRANTQQLLRQELVRILAAPPGRFSRPAPLRESAAAIWALVNDRHDWKKARDLALFSLASYGQFSGRVADEQSDVTEPDKGAQ